MLNRYFSEKRPLANGLSAAGSPVALCCLSPLGQVLQYQYGWRGGFLILGGLLLNCCVCGALMKPLVAPKADKEKDLDKSVGEGAEGAETKKKPKAKLLDFSVFKDCGFIIYTVSASIMVLGLFVPPVFVVSYAKELGYEDTKSALLLTILGFIDIFARPLCGVIAGLKWVRPRCVYLFSFAMLFNGTTDLIGSQVGEGSVAEAEGKRFSLKFANVCEHILEIFILNVFCIPGQGLHNSGGLLHLLWDLLRHGGSAAVRGSDGHSGYREVLQRYRPGAAHGGHCCAGGATWCRSVITNQLAELQHPV